MKIRLKCYVESTHITSCYSVGTWEVVVKTVLISMMVILSSLAFSQESWQRYQDANSRVALFIEPSDSQDTSLRNVVRLFTNTTIGDTIFWLSGESFSRDNYSSFNCEAWQWQGVISNSLVFEISEYTAYISPSSGLLGGILDSYKRESVGTESWGSSLFSLCSLGKLDVEDKDIKSNLIYVPLSESASSPVPLTPASLWGRAFLVLTYNQSIQELRVDLR